METVSLIGREFLTWLWFKAEERNGRIKLSGKEEVELHFLKRIALEAGEGEYAQGVVCHGIHAELTEGKEANTAGGKKSKEAGIKLIHDNNEWEFAIKADSFDIQSLKLPAPDWQETPEDRRQEACWKEFTSLKNAVKTMDKLYESFLQIRFSPQWKEKETKLLNKWLEQIRITMVYMTDVYGWSFFSPVRRLMILPEMSGSGNTSQAAPSLTASPGMPKTTEVASS